jgi:post-segregation antitoxin (ccd killing protein)
MRMARINIYLPDELAGEAKRAGMNISALTQEAVRAALGSTRIDGWLDELESLRPTGIAHEDVVAAVDEARDELEGLD